MIRRAFSKKFNVQSLRFYANNSSAAAKYPQDTDAGANKFSNSSDQNKQNLSMTNNDPKLFNDQKQQWSKKDGEFDSSKNIAASGSQQWQKDSDKFIDNKNQQQQWNQQEKKDQQWFKQQDKQADESFKKDADFDFQGEKLGKDQQSWSQQQGKQEGEFQQQGDKFAKDQQQWNKQGKDQQLDKFNKQGYKVQDSFQENDKNYTILKQGESKAFQQQDKFGQQGDKYGQQQWSQQGKDQQSLQQQGEFGQKSEGYSGKDQGDKFSEQHWSQQGKDQQLSNKSGLQQGDQFSSQQQFGNKQQQQAYSDNDAGFAKKDRFQDTSSLGEAFAKDQGFGESSKDAKLDQGKQANLADKSAKLRDKNDIAKQY